MGESSRLMGMNGTGLQTGTNEIKGRGVSLLNSELGLDKNRYDREMGQETRAHAQGREGTGSCGLNMSRRIVGTLVIPHAGTSPHK